MLNNHLLRAYYLGFDRSSWIVLIKSEILITTGMVWPVRSDKWKVPYVYASGLIVIRHLHISHNTPYSTPKIVDNLCCWFLQDITVIPREIETVVGWEGGEQTWCIMGDMQMANYLFSVSFTVLYVHP